MSAPEKAATTYIVLVMQNQPGATADADELAARIWHHAGEVEARSADAAIRKWLDGRVADTSPRVYVAIASRSFQPVRVQPRTVTTLDIQAAT